MSESKTYQFLCPQCRQRTPTLIRDEYRVHCPHNRLTVIQSTRGHRVVYDQDETARGGTRPAFDDRGRYMQRTVYTLDGYVS